MGGTRNETAHSQLVVVSGLLITMSAAPPVFAQKQGGIIKLSHFDSPASMSILEESTRAALQPAMGIPLKVRVAGGNGSAG